MRLNGNHEAKPRTTNGKVKFKPKRKYKLNSNGIQNGDGADAHWSLANDSDDSVVQIDFDNVLPRGKAHRQNGTSSAQNSTTTATTTRPISECNGSPSLRQKVKFITADRFVHIKPPPINTEKIYVKQQANGSRSYALGDIPVLHNKLITVTQKDPNDHATTMAAPIASSSSSYKSDEDTYESELTSLTTDDGDANLENVNIFDIPILFADSDLPNDDGNQILANGNGIHSTPMNDTLVQPNQMEPSKTIEIISEEIITDAIIGKLH